MALLLIKSPGILDMIIMVLFWGMVGMAWNIAGGYAGQFSVGHSAFLGIGAYTSTILYVNYDLSPWFGMLIAGGICGLLAALLGAIFARLKSYFFALATIAFAQIVLIVVIQMHDLTNGSMGITIPFKPGFGNMIFSSLAAYGWLILVLAALVYCFSKFISINKLGHYLRALRESEDASRALGINPVRMRMTALALSAFITGAAGTFYAQYTLFINPGSLISLSVSVQIALLAILGGIGSPIGPVLGAAVIVPLGLFLRQASSAISGLDLMTYGLIMMLVVIYFPKGLVFYMQKLNVLLAGSSRRD
jgi:branched-chain amino acid transport system permease protein